MRLVKLISGLLSADKIILSRAKQILEKYYGSIDLESPVIPFDFTDYYDEELGKGILRQYISFRKLIRPEYIARIKRHTIRLERRFIPPRDGGSRPGRKSGDESVFGMSPHRGVPDGTTGVNPWGSMIGGNRKVNIDPGYVSLDKLLLATTKDATYRIYMGKGIYAQSTLFFQKGSFHPWHWTYPDYRTDMAIEFFNKVRDVYKTQR